MDVVGGVAPAGEADLAPDGPGSLNLVAGPQGLQAVVGGVCEILRNVESLDAGCFFWVSGRRERVIFGTEDGGLEQGGGKLDDDGGGFGRGGAPRADPEAFRDAVWESRDGGEKLLFFGMRHDRLEDPVIDQLGGYLARGVGGVFLLIGHGEAVDPDGAGPVQLLKLVELLLD